MINWQPTASLRAIKARAELYQLIRDFFQKKEVLEVETPILATHTVTDIHLQSFKLRSLEKFCQTSPEYAMKRLLAAYRCSIYQITKAFRKEEAGIRHNPEFSMLEWYRVGFDHIKLMEEVYELFCSIFGNVAQLHKSYNQLFREYLALDLETATIQKLADCCLKNDIHLQDATLLTKDDFCNLLMSYIIEPSLPKDKIVFVDNFPKTQAALATINSKGYADRFECYYQGYELANGYNELTDPCEQLARFRTNNELRAKNKLPDMAIDTYLIAALEHGLPKCAGVAMGLDRVLMLKLGTKKIADVISFPWEIM